MENYNENKHSNLLRMESIKDYLEIIQMEIENDLLLNGEIIEYIIEVLNKIKGSE